MLQVITDSTADLPAEIAQQEGIIVVPCQVIFDDQSYREDVDLSSQEFFEKLRTAGTLPKTSLPRGDDFAAAYEEAQARGAESVLAIHIGSNFSGVYNAARLYAGNLDMPTRVIDSGTTSLAMGLLAIHAARRAREGAPLHNLADEIRRLAGGAEVHAMLDTLEYARRGGRIGRVAETVASILNIKPVLRVARNSVDLVSRHRSRKRAMQALVDTIADAKPEHGTGLVHAEAPALADELRERIASLPHAPKEMIVNSAGAVLSTHAGPGAVGIGFVR